MSDLSNEVLRSKVAALEEQVTLQARDLSTLDLMRRAHDLLKRQVADLKASKTHATTELDQIESELESARQARAAAADSLELERELRRTTGEAARQIVDLRDRLHMANFAQLHRLADNAGVDPLVLFQKSNDSLDALVQRARALLTRDGTPMVVQQMSLLLLDVAEARREVNRFQEGLLVQTLDRERAFKNQFEAEASTAAVQSSYVVVPPSPTSSGGASTPTSAALPLPARGDKVDTSAVVGRRRRLSTMKGKGKEK